MRTAKQRLGRWYLFQKLSDRSYLVEVNGETVSLSMGISEEIEDAKITAEKTKISRLKRRSEN